MSFNKQQSHLFLFRWAIVLTLAANGITGCHLGRPGSSSFASIVIKNQSLKEIIATTGNVFHENGYAVYSTGKMTMRFEKEGTQMNNLAYNGIIGTHYGAQTVVRVKAEIVDIGGGSYRLQCQAFMVTDAGDSFFEDEKRLTNFRSGPYQKVLNQIAKRLKPNH